MSTSEETIEEVLEKCLYTKLAKTNNSLRNRFLNFIYTGQDFDKELTMDTIKAIGRIYGNKKPSFWLQDKPLSEIQMKAIGNQIINLIKDGWNSSIHKTKGYYDKFTASKKFQVRALIASENPPFKVDEGEKFSGTHLLGDGPLDKSGPYYNAIRGCYETDESIAEYLFKNGILFLDILPIPLPVDSELRDKWSTEFYVDGMPLSAWLFELAIQHYTNKYECRFDKDTNVALMMPINTSNGIFLQANDKDYLPELNKKLREPTKKKDAQKLLAGGITPPRYKANVMGGANRPSAELLKRIIKKRK
jgi:hypothetical protein